MEFFDLKYTRVFSVDLERVWAEDIVYKPPITYYIIIPIQYMYTHNSTSFDERGSFALYTYFHIFLSAIFRKRRWIIVRQTFKNNIYTVARTWLIKNYAMTYYYRCAIPMCNIVFEVNVLFKIIRRNSIWLLVFKSLTSCTTNIIGI